MSENFTVKRIFWMVALLAAFQFQGTAQHQPALRPDRIILNMTEKGESSVSVTWRTNELHAEGFIEIQPVPAGPVDKSISKVQKAVTTAVSYEYPDEPTVKVHQHSVLIEDLKPGSRYLYRAGSDLAWSEWLEFRLATNEPDKFSFIYFGDPQNDIRSQWSRVIRAAYRHNPEASFMVYAGDIINRAGRDVEWQEFFDAGSFILSTIPQVMTPGNHDYRNQVLDPHWKYQFSQPLNGPQGVKHTCFAIDYKNLKLISLDTATESELRSENGTALKIQQAWLDSVLASNTKTWVIVTTHLPIYSPKENRDNAHIRKAFQPLFEKYGVDLVLTGHDHSYGRGMATDDPKAKPSVMYVVSVSGPKFYEAGDKPWMQVKGSGKQLFQNISIDGKKLEYKAYTADGALFDHFRLKKRNN
jgi:acid phosphatase type 7